MSYLLIIQLTLSISWGDLVVDDYDYAIQDYEIDGQASRLKVKR